MNVEYLWAAGCGTCRGLKDQGVVYDLERMLLPFPNIYFSSNPIGEVGNGHFALENGTLTQKRLIVGEGLYQFEERQNEGDEPLGTPMMHLVDPISGEFSEVYIADILGETEDEVVSMIRDSPWLCKRLITKRLWRFYLAYCIDAPSQVKEQLRKGLEPEYKDGEYQLKRWQDAFRRAREIEF